MLSAQQLALAVVGRVDGDAATGAVADEHDVCQQSVAAQDGLPAYVIAPLVRVRWGSSERLREVAYDP